ncbi:MAG: lipase [Gammaproteobacteria bacterium]|nr:lipase [Gammaproteobacteria bacterium]
MARIPSGVRLQFQTASKNVGLELLVTRMLGQSKVSVNLEHEGELHEAQVTSGNRIVLDASEPAGYKVERGSSQIAWFRGLLPGMKNLQLWLPHNAYVEMRNLHIDDDCSVTCFADSRPCWVHYGSSISHCMEAQMPAETWPAVASRRLQYSLINLGFGGQCHLDPFVARTIRDLNAQIISLKVGINIVNMDSLRERVFSPMFHGFLDTIREVHQTTPLILCSPIYCPSAETKPGPTIPNSQGRFETIEGFEALRQGCLTLQRIRTLMEEIVAARIKKGDSNLHYVNGLELFGSADSDDLPDDLHPNPAGYIRIGERFAAKVSEMRLFS